MASKISGDGNLFSFDIVAAKLYDVRLSETVLIALCTVGIQAHVGQAGIGTIHQAQVSNLSPGTAKHGNRPAPDAVSVP